MGEVGLAWLDNNPILIEDPGTYEVDSPSFKFVSILNAADKKIVLGAKKIITVYQGEVAVTFKSGTLQILQPGRHYIDAADHFMDDFISTQQRSIKLDPEEGPPGRPSPPGCRELLVCETKDLVKIGIRADVFYSICNAEQVITTVGRKFIAELVKETCIATLINIVRSTALGEIAQSSAASAQSSSEHAQGLQAAQATAAPSAPLFFDKAHDQFLSKLHDDFKQRYGIEITNIRIEQFKILDEALQASISGQAVKTAATQAGVANLAGQTQISIQERERDSRLMQIQAEADARTMQTRANAEKAQAEAIAAAQQVKSDMEANMRRTQAQAEADAVRTKAQAEADAVKIQAEAIVDRAKAEAEAIRLTAQAEGERAHLLSATPLGEKLSLLQIYGEMVKTSNEGVSKVVYVDPTTTQAGNPMALLTLQSLQKDIAQLEGAP